MIFKANKVHGGQKNIVYVLSGLVNKEDEGKAVCLVSELDRAVKLASVAFLVQEKMGLQLWWDEALTEPMLPVESRGAFRFDGVRPPPDWAGQIWVKPFKVDMPGEPRVFPKMFVLSLDFDR
jgi:hypothetical protein